MVRLALAITGLILSASGIGAIFWKQELRYQLPTPVPTNYNSIALGQAIALPDDFKKGTAYFVHFYNPDCPCSRFNSRHVKSLIRAHEDSIQMVIVVPDEQSFSKARNEFEDIPIVIDYQESIVQATGVYSTPQAVIVDQHHRLYYRGNYNKSRYCTAKATNFAELALVALLNQQPSPQFGLIATQSYGCEWGKESEIELF